MFVQVQLIGILGQTIAVGSGKWYAEFKMIEILYIL